MLLKALRWPPLLYCYGLIVKIASHVPLIQCLVYFSLDTHRAALKKFAVLWILASLPILFAAALSPIPDGDLNVVEKLYTKLREAISVSEQFVYTASFITPILYIIFEKLQDIPKFEPGESLSQRLRIVFDGYGFVSLAALITILLTATAFSALKTNSAYFQASFLNHFLNIYSPHIYLFALYCWYLSLLDGMKTGDFVQQNRDVEKQLSSSFSARINQRGQRQ